MIMAGEEMLGELKEKGTQREFLDQMMTRERQNELLDYQAYFEIEKKYIPGE
jgi:2-methylisocitrate lyase-like PEP mutase family enzyme